VSGHPQSPSAAELVAAGREAQARLTVLETRLSQSEAREAQLLKQVQDLTARCDQLAKAHDALQRQHQTLGAGLADARLGILNMSGAAAQPTPKPGSGRPIVDLVSQLRADTQSLFAQSIATSGRPGVVVEGLDVEIRGDLDLGDKVGIRTFAPGQSGPAAASVIRFSLKPELRIEVPDKPNK
jgi:hypothetical protein